MAKDPAFLFYPGDFLSGTMYMTFEQKGAYMVLLILQFNCHQFNEAQAKQVLSICFDVAWPMLKLKFKRDGEYFYNERLREEIDKRKKFTESRRTNAKGSKSTKKHEDLKEASAEHMLQHMEDENINIIIDVNLVIDIIRFFDFSENVNHDKLREVRLFVSFLTNSKRIEYFKIQFESYKNIKSKNPKFKHSLENFMGTIKEMFEDGKWNSENWTAKDETVKIKPNDFQF